MMPPLCFDLFIFFFSLRAFHFRRFRHVFDFFFFHAAYALLMPRCCAMPLLRRAMLPPLFAAMLTLMPRA